MESSLDDGNPMTVSLSIGESVVAVSLTKSLSSPKYLPRGAWTSCSLSFRHDCSTLLSEQILLRGIKGKYQSHAGVRAKALP